EIIRHLVPGERVRVLVRDEKLERQAHTMLRRTGVDSGRVDWFRIPTDRAWTRDYCPLFLRGPNGDLGLVGWRFTGRAEYSHYRRDAAVPRRIARRLRRPLWLPVAAENGGHRRVVLEGGAIELNGRGALLTTEECLLSPVQARNPGLPREDLEQILADHLGIR